MDEKEKKEFHKNLGIELFNKTWDLIDRENKNQQEIDRMIHAACLSLPLGICWWPCEYRTRRMANQVMSMLC